MKKVVIVAIISFGFLFKGYSQEINNPILTAVPFLQVIPDARSGGMADMGVASRPDANSQYHNPAKYAFSESQFTLSATYTPWLRNLTNDVFLGHITFSNRISESSAWAASFNYFSVGRIETNQGQFDQNGRLISTGTENPNDLSLDVSYSLKLSDEFSMGVKLGYVRSDLSIRSS
ncbi:MAG: PorV/PorQ family protein, partial [Flavobacteriaceae bacterium]|nr:PorV/PorQ family protein [Flavobacteriaceae bacterium]